jgi:hypothetical protein
MEVTPAPAAASQRDALAQAPGANYSIHFLRAMH